MEKSIFGLLFTVLFISAEVGCSVQYDCLPRHSNSEELIFSVGEFIDGLVEGYVQGLIEGSQESELSRNWFELSDESRLILLFRPVFAEFVMSRQEEARKVLLVSNYAGLSLQEFRNEFALRCKDFFAPLDDKDVSAQLVNLCLRE